MQEKEIIDLAKKNASENGFEGEAADAFVSAFVENFKKGYAEGMAEERAKAEKEKLAEKIEMVKRMLAKGLDISDIADFTGLSVDEIKAIE